MPARFPVIGYFPSWSGGNVGRIQFEKLTHINYSFVFPTPDGNLSEVDDALLKNLVKQSHDRGVKVGIAIGGWNDGDCTAFEKMAANASSRITFVRSALELCKKYELDGVDIDWEYPKENSADDFVILMTMLERELHGRGKFLSTAVIAMEDEYGEHIHASVFGMIDYLNIMAYDWKYQDGRSHSPYDVAEQSLDYWLARGCPKAKAILGVPFYGRMPPLSYADLLKMDPDAPNKDKVGETSYNGRETIGKKTELAFRKGGGIMIWEITHDTSDQHSLLGAIHQKAQTFRLIS